jgi:uncharacterized protein
MMQNKPPLIVICPHCGMEQHWDAKNRFRPFCSERCKMIDLGKWANEEYRVQQSETGQREQDSAEEDSIPDSFRS